MGLFTDGFKELKKASEPLYKSPKSIQETIEIMAVAENGIFEVARNRYSKCYLFQDINYTTTNEDEQIDIFERYCKFLNSLDCNYKITVNNKNKNMAELREKVMFPKKDDGFDEYRQAYNDIIEEKILDGRQGIEQERYLTLTIERKNFEEAKAQFATLEATIHKAFNELGNSEFVALLKQANTDSSKMAEVIGVSDAQLRFVTNSQSGMGLLKCGNVVIPFDNQIGKDTSLYKLYNTNIHEKIAEQRAKENHVSVV